MRFSLLLIVGLALVVLPCAPAQTPIVPVKIDLLLNPEFCASVIKSGSLATADRASYPVGPVACAKLPEELKAVFPQLNVVNAPVAVGSRGSALTLIPKMADFGTNSPTTIGDLKELDIYVEWAAENPDGKLLWLGTVKGTASEKPRIWIQQHYYAKDLLPGAIRDLANNLVREMLAAPSLQAVIHPAPPINAP